MRLGTCGNIDAGNRRIASVKLLYHVEERIALKDVPDQAK